MCRKRGGYGEEGINAVSLFSLCEMSATRPVLGVVV